MNYDADFVEDFIDPQHSDRVDNESVSELAKMTKEQHDQLGEALSIINDLADLHDSYIGYLVTHNNYNDASAKALYERIQVLLLKQ